MEIFRRGEIVARLVNPMPDMWYLEGEFVAVDTEAGARFVSDASALDVKCTMRDVTRAIRTTIREKPDDEGQMFLILSLSDGMLFGRCVYEAEAHSWAMAHISE